MQPYIPHAYSFQAIHTFALKQNAKLRKGLFIQPHQIIPNKDYFYFQLTSTETVGSVGQAKFRPGTKTTEI